MRSGSDIRGSSLAQPAGGVLNRLDDLHIAGAAAQMPDHGVADLVLARIGVLVEQRLCRQDESRGAEAALDAALLHEGFLDLIELAAVSERCDGLDVLALRLHRQIEAGVDRLAVDENRAGAALA